MVRLSARPEVADDIIDEQPSVDTIATTAQQRLIQICDTLTLIVLPLALEDQHRNTEILAGRDGIG